MTSKLSLVPHCRIRVNDDSGGRLRQISPVEIDIILRGSGPQVLAGERGQRPGDFRWWLFLPNPQKSKKSQVHRSHGQRRGRCEPLVGMSGGAGIIQRHGPPVLR